MTTAAETAWVLQQHRRRATPRSELAARLSERILAAPTHEQLLERMVQEDELELVESPRGSVANHTEVAISLAMGWKNKALKLEQSLAEKIAELSLARSGSAGSAAEAECNPSPTPPAVGSPAIAAGTSISALTPSPLKRRSSAVDASASPTAAAAGSSPRWGLPPLGSPLIKRAERFEDKAMQTSTILGKDVETQSGNGEVRTTMKPARDCIDNVHCLECAELRRQLDNERRRVLFYQNENRRLELRDIRSPPEELEAPDAEFGMTQPQAAMQQPDFAYAQYGAPLQGEGLPAMSPALSVVPEGDEQAEGEMKQMMEGEAAEQQEEEKELKQEESNVGEISPPDESNDPEAREEPENVGYLSESPSLLTPPTPPPSPVMPSDPEDEPAAIAVAQETAAVVVQVVSFAAGSVTVEDEPPGMDVEEAAEMDVEVFDPQLSALNAAAAGEAEQKAPSTDSANAGLITTPQWAHARARAAGFTLPLHIDMHGQLLGWMIGGPEELLRAKQEVERQRQEERREQSRREEEGKRSGEGMQE